MASIDNLLVSLFVDEVVGGFIVTIPPGHVGCIYSIFRGVIKKMVKILEPTPVLVGAGIHQAKDVEVSLKMGARGILVASDVVKAEDPRKELLELAEVFRV